MSLSATQTNAARRYLLFLPLYVFVAFCLTMALQTYPEATTIIVISLVVLVASAWIMQATTRFLDLSRLTVPGFWYLAYITMIFIPTLIIFLEKTGPHRYTFLVAVEGTMITVPLGIMFANLVLGFTRGEIKKYYDSPMLERLPGGHYMFRCKIALLVAAGIVIAYMLEARTIPLFMLPQYQGDSLALALLRENSMKLLASPLRFIYHLLRDFGYPLLILNALGFYIFYRTRAWRFLFIATLLSGLVYSAFSLARLPAAAIFFMIFLFLYMHFRQRKLLALAPPLIFGFPMMVMGSQGLTDITLIINTIFERIFLAPASILYYYYEVVPDHTGFLFGRTMGRLTWLTGQEYFNIENFVYQYITSSPIQSGSANAAFIGNLYADFAMPGVLLGGFVIGILMQGVNVYMLRQQKTVFNTAAYTTVTYTFALLTILPLTSILVFSGLPLLLAILIVSNRNRRLRQEVA